jgi:hypothetical protein
MKPRLSIGWSLLICAVLVVFGLMYGNVSGYADERARVNTLLEGDGGLMTVLNYRARDGLNLCVVADRHLAGDADVEALRNAADGQLLQGLSVQAAHAGDEALADAFFKVSTKLAADAGFTASARDVQYRQMIAADFEACGQSDIFATYNKAAEAFARQLAVPGLGDVARFFGVKPCELYQ